MSARVNLLPQESRDRNRRSRQLAGMAVGAAALLVALGGVWFWQQTQIDSAEAELATAEDELRELRADLASLNEFAELRSQRDEVDLVLSGLMASEMSFAGFLQDVAAVTPSDVELAALSVALDASEEDPTLGETQGSMASVSLSGLTTSSHAPGLERLLIELDKLAAFRNPYFSSSTLRDGDVPGNLRVNDFALEFDLGPEVRTHRYADGLPEDLR